MLGWIFYTVIYLLSKIMIWKWDIMLDKFVCSFSLNFEPFVTTIKENYLEFSSKISRKFNMKLTWNPEIQHKQFSYNTLHHLNKSTNQARHVRVVSPTDSVLSRRTTGSFSFCFGGVDRFVICGICMIEFAYFPATVVCFPNLVPDLFNIAK